MALLAPLGLLPLTLVRRPAVTVADQPQ